ncbi:hypothetical protein [Halobaculum sp. MBLA0143]|uniref:hypothetical protein n=1 Tax=Halobaculum sp. MBLA0143 TaxID=3079933 RepID=UPI003524630C
MSHDRSLRTRLRSLARRVRPPEHTGENRCRPCTALNTLLVALVGGALASQWPLVGGATVVVGLASVAVRGYAVPYTPTLTRRYLPDRVWAWFHAPTVSDEDDPNAERVLVAAGILRSTGEGDDELELSPPFRSRWQSATDRLGTAADPDALLRLAEFPDVEPSAVSFRRSPEQFEAFVDDTAVAEWESPTAARLDLAAAPLVARRSSHWGSLDFEARTTVLAGLRLWLDRCPDCRGQVALSRETVPSCCRDVPVVAGGCVDCGTRLFEAPVPRDGERARQTND